MGIWGYSVLYSTDQYDSNAIRLIDIIYSTIRLFAMESSPSEIQDSIWQLSIARLFAGLTVFGAVIAAGYHLLKEYYLRWYARTWYSNHTIICGLSDRGRELAVDLLGQGKCVAIIETNPNNVYVDEVKKIGAVVIIGDAATGLGLNNAGINKARDLFTLTDDDVANLDIFGAILKENTTQLLHCHIHITRSENRSLFAKGGCFSIERIKSNNIIVTVFNLYEYAAIKLFEENTLGGNSDTVNSTSAAVKILICGFGNIGKAVVLEAMTIGHFYNKKPIKIEILADNQDEHRESFYKKHHQVQNHANGKGLNLWEIEFIESLDEIGRLSEYNHIISAHDNENESLSSILEIDELYRMEEQEKNNTILSFYSPRWIGLKETKIQPFGELSKLCSVHIMINDALEQSSKYTHNTYAREKISDHASDELPPNSIDKALLSHDINIDNPDEWLLWENQPLYKRRSNMAEKRHIPIKLLAFNLKPSDLAIPHERISSLGEHKLPYLERLDDVKDSAEILFYEAQKKGIDIAKFIKICHRLAEVEHRRWAAFHIIDNWREGKSKNETTKTHNCIIEWNELTTAFPDTIKYDYKIIYQIPDSLSCASKEKINS